MLKTVTNLEKPGKHCFDIKLYPKESVNILPEMLTYTPPTYKKRDKAERKQQKAARKITRNNRK